MFDIIKNKSLIKKFITNSKIDIIQPLRKDIDIAVKWTAEENWNPGINDADIYYQADPSGFFMGVYKNEPIGFIFSITYSDNFTVAGVFIVKKEYRNKGLGVELGFKFLSFINNKTVSITSVANKVKLYSSIGFKPEFNVIRYCYQNLNKINLPELPLEYKFVLINNNFNLFDKILNYDILCFPSDRSKILRLWIYQSNSFSIAVLDSSDKLKGYGVLRKSYTGYRFEPLYADSYIIAEQIFFKAVNMININEPVFIDIPENNPDALIFAEKYNFIKVFPLVRMFNSNIDKIRKIDNTRIFGLFE